MRRTTNGIDLFCMSMCHAKLGNKVAAKDCFERAVKWGEGKHGLSLQEADEYDRFRAEAARLLPR